MNLYKLFFSFLFFLFCSTDMQGQEKEYVYVDSTLLYPDVADSNKLAAPEEDDYGDSTTINYPTDTSLLYNELILSRDSIRRVKNTRQFAYAKVMDSLLKDLQRKQAEASSNIQPEEPSAFGEFLSSGITRFIFWSLAVFFVLFIIYKLFFTEGFLQRQPAKSPVTLKEVEEEDINGNTDYDKQVALAADNKNYRLAIRYLYLQSVQKLRNAGAITFASDKTNSQYLHELNGKPYRQEFASLTMNYEYVWYGEFLIDENIFSKLQQRFKQFNNQLKSS
jgi:superfamily II DNA or RNA helicase